MGWKAKALAVLLGLMFVGLGAWPLGLVCLVYLAVSLRPKSTGKAGQKRHIPVRILLAALLFILTAAAFASGGSLSPLVFFAAGAAALTWPIIAGSPPLTELTPVGDSILLKSKYIPFRWHSIAELKPGAEPFPMAASAFSGTLMMFTDSGRTYSAVECRASGRKEAEARVLAEFRSCSPAGRAGAFLLPLDSQSAADLLRLRLSPLRLRDGDLTKSAPGTSGLIILRCHGGMVEGASAFRIDGPAKSPGLPAGVRSFEAAPLTWEVFDAVGKRTRWPDPDGYSDLLDSMLATRGAPFTERLTQLESSGDRVTVRSLAGEPVAATRPQLRAILSIYS